MSIRFFGQYLLEKKLITKKQLLDALNFQNTHNLKIGEMGIALGLITNEEVNRIHMEQRSNDIPFGQLAIRFGLLAQEDIDRIIEEQQNNRMSLGEILVNQRSLTADDMEKELQVFHKEQAQYEMEVPLPESMPHKDIITASVSITSTLCIRIADLKVKIGPWRKLEEGSDVGQNVVLIPMRGVLKGYYLIATPPRLSARISSKMFNEYIAESDNELLCDALKEFANIIAGNIISKISRDDAELDIDTPEVVDKLKLIRGQEGILYNMHTSDNTFIIGLIWEKKTAP